MSDITIEDVLDRPERWQVVSTDDIEAEAAVEYFPADDECSIPQVVFTWRHTEFFHKADDLAALRDAGFEFEGHGVHLARASGARASLTFMNFRRYGWSWAWGTRASDGYAGGHVYANGPVFDGGMMTCAPLTVRDSFVIAVNKLMAWNGPLPAYFNCADVHAVLEVALLDALSNVTSFADTRRAAGTFRGRVSGVGDVRQFVAQSLSLAAIDA